MAASAIAAVTVLQLVREQDGVGKCPLESAFDPDHGRPREMGVTSADG